MTEQFTIPQEMLDAAKKAICRKADELNVLIGGDDERAFAQVALEAAHVGELVAAARDALGVVQASLVNARNRNEYPAIIANLEMKEANLRNMLAKIKGRLND